MIHRPLLYTCRVASALGLTALVLTEEVNPIFAWLGWSAWALSLFLDRFPAVQKRLRMYEAPAVALMVVLFLFDFFRLGSSIFLSVAHFLLVLQITKLIGLKERKDSLQILLVSFFQALSACTLSVNIWQGAVILALIPVTTAGLFWLQVACMAEEFPHAYAQGYPPAYKRLITGICVAAIPVNIVLATLLFLAFPRLGFRAFAGLGLGKSGYTEEINLLQGGAIHEDSSIVMWMEIMPPKDRLRWKGYLRGSTLGAFDGKQWSRVPAASTVRHTDSSGLLRLFPGEHPLQQRITLVQSAGSTLFGAPVVGQVSAPFSTLQVMADDGFRWTTGWRKPVRYEVMSYDTILRKVSPLSNGERHIYLALPPISFQRTKALLAQVRSTKSPRKRAADLEKYLREHYAYSLGLGAGQSANPVEEFLFVQQRGPCGYFASAMATMLRLEGIPSRVVTGYYQGRWNSQAERYAIRARDAHAWVEAYIDNVGWVSFDPTPRALTPDARYAWIDSVRENWVYLSYQWDKMVVEYDLYSQVQAIEDLQQGTQRMNSLTQTWWTRLRRGHDLTFWPEGHYAKFFIVIGLLVIVGLSWQMFRRGLRRGKSYDAEIAFYKQFLNDMAKKGYPKNANETGHEFLNRLTGDEKEHASPITERYYAVRFQTAQGR